MIQDKPTFLMVVQKNEDNVYDQHLLEIELQKQGMCVRFVAPLNN